LFYINATNIDKLLLKNTLEDKFIEFVNKLTNKTKIFIKIKNKMVIVISIYRIYSHLEIKLNV